MDIVINNNLISYLNFGSKGNNQTLLFLHGWRSQKEIWDQIVSRIKYHVSSIYCIDLPGFGQSPAPRDAWSVVDYAQIVKEFIKKLELKNVVLVGHSFGGRVGIKLAAQYPNLVSKLVLVDAAGFSMPSNQKKTMAMAAKIAKPFFKPKFMQGLRKKIYQTIGAEDYLATPELQKTFVNVVNEDLTEDMKRITCPILIIWGDRDTETPIEYLHKMQSLIPNTKYHILSNSGHFSFLDKPDEFVKALMRFV